MKNGLKSNKILSQAGFGVTGALLTGSFALCFCAVTGQGLLSFLICCVLCFIFSIKNSDGVFSPHAFLILPLFYSLSGGSALAAGLSVSGGALVFIFLSKLLKKQSPPDFLISGAGLGLAIGVTILLTNSYFGIGANSFTPFDMLKEFRSLGFHPNFRGLFYGTITLFAMITFPFKFKKLSKYLPAAFVTLLIPFIFNLFLNPQRDLTTINESVTLVFKDSLRDEFLSFTEISNKDTPFMIKGAMGFGAVFYFFDSREAKTCPVNCLSGILSGIPAKKHPIKTYSIISAIISILTITLSVFLCPDIFSRLPLHCAGSMLIVSAWQSLPSDSLKNLFKERRLIYLLFMIFCAVSFLIADILTSTLVCFVLWGLSDLLLRKECAK